MSLAHDIPFDSTYGHLPVPQVPVPSNSRPLHRMSAALRLEPTNAILYTHRGDAYRLHGEYERAIADFHVALRLSPQSPDILVSRATAYRDWARSRRSRRRPSAPVRRSPPAAW